MFAQFIFLSHFPTIFFAGNIPWCKFYLVHLDVHIYHNNHFVGPPICQLAGLDYSLEYIVHILVMNLTHNC